MTTVADIEHAMQAIAPLELAESWDAVGLLVGDRQRIVHRVLCCLTITFETAIEAVDRQCELVVAHHPLPFRPVSRIVTDDPTGYLLWRLIGAGISIYSPHTAWDNSSQGINQQLADALGLIDVEPILPSKIPSDASGGRNAKAQLSGQSRLGTGRWGRMTQAIQAWELVKRLESLISIERPRMAGDPGRPIQTLGIVCGSGASLIQEVAQHGCDALLTGEATYHHCLEALHRGIHLILIGHHASERFAMDRLAAILASEMPYVEFLASQREKDPVQTLR